MRLLRWRCRSCSAPWATSMPGETGCPFCGSQDIEGPVNARRARIMDVQRKLRRDRTRPLDHVRGGAYPTSRIRRRAVSIDPHADAGKVGRPPLPPQRRFARYVPAGAVSEGLLQACPQVLNPCPDDRRTGDAGAEGFRTAKVGAAQGRAVPRTHHARSTRSRTGTAQ